MFYSPLRYPGGKGKLAPFIELLINKTGHVGGTYIEPFAGGAGIALELLEKNVVNDIVINDLDKGIYSFWRAILTEKDRFINDVCNVKLNIDEWNRQREVIKNCEKYSYELGFATFYLNRTNRSGIIKGGVIGGIEQSGDWKMDARFNREALIERIINITENKNHIYIYNKDIDSFIQNFLPKYQQNAFIYFDPPYFKKGKQLYMNYLSYDDHVRIEKLVNDHIDCDWVITYDDSQEIEDIYKKHVSRKFDLNYSVASKRKSSEIIIFKHKNMIPTETQMRQKGISINLR